MASIALRAIATQNSKLAVVLSRFGGSAELLRSEIALLLQLGRKAFAVSAGSTSLDIGASPFFILSGWLCRSQTDESGNRAILEFLLPGDLVWPLAPHCSGLELMVEVLADSVIAPATPIIDACRMHTSNYPGLSRGLAMYTEVDRKHLLSQVTRLLQMDAPTRLHALIVEIYGRLKHVGLSFGDSFACPLSQSVFADATGLSIVHASRCFGALTRAGLITRTRSLMTVCTKAIEAREITTLARVSQHDGEELGSGEAVGMAA
jgi:CRP-like cAMP-binding protein